VPVTSGIEAQAAFEFDGRCPGMIASRRRGNFGRITRHSERIRTHPDHVRMVDDSFRMQNGEYEQTG
jgi:hypothetical protein